MTITIENVELTKFFLALAMLLLSANFFGYVFTKLRMPKVVGEIIGGLIFGPTLFGYFLPELYKRIFISQGELLAIVYWIGLVLLMFNSGFELERGFNKKDKKTIAWLVISSTIIPLIFGWFAISMFDVKSLIGQVDNILALKIVIAVAIAVTSIPVLSKIFMDLGIIKTRFAKIVLSAATFHDIILWVFVAIATGIASGAALSIFDISFHILISLAFFAIALLLMPRIIDFVDNLRLNLIPKHYETGFILSILLIFVVIAGYFEINIAFGAFLAGIVVGCIRNPKFQNVRVHVKEFSLAFFVPIYFAMVGIKLDLIRNLDISLLLFFSLFAFAVQGIGIFITTKLLDYNWKSSLNYAIVMNDRGGPCIVLATIALDFGIISENLFTTLVLLAILTSIIAGSWLRFVINRKWNVLN